MRIRLVVAAVVVAAGLLGLSVPRVSADPALTLTAPASANLGSGAPGTTISAAIGPVTVTDDRALLTASWTVTAAETDFANGAQTIPASDASYAPGTITTTGDDHRHPDDPDAFEFGPGRRHRYGRSGRQHSKLGPDGGGCRASLRRGRHLHRDANPVG